MQGYTKLQKYISFLLILSILFSFTINVSFFSFVGKIFASDNTNYNLVSIFVDENIYSSIKWEVSRYAEDIQGVLWNTKTIIIPTSSEEHPFNIASVNEKLYFEWANGFWFSGESHLVWSVFIWDLPLPIVENNWSYEKTVFPYVDFQEKLYIYDKEGKRYKLNNNFSKEPKAEIWHWFISPNTWDEDEDVKEIKDYFDKNHDYYTWKWLFDSKKWVINWVQNEELDKDYKPYVFYYDQIRESWAVSYVNYKAYEQYLDNIEDLNYNRYSKELAKKLSGNYLNNQNEFTWDLSTVFWTWFDFSAYSWSMVTDGIPDIQTRYIINNWVKRLIQIFNSSTLWEFRTDVHNAWRYNSWSSSVWVDLVPYLASWLDVISESVVRNVNNDLEWEIDNIIKKWLSRKIAIPTTFNIQTKDFENNISTTTYTNYLYWTNVSNITDAGSCSIYRWSNSNSWTLVESNRWFNIWNVQSDTKTCQNANTMWYWWGNSPLNLKTSSAKTTLWQLNYKDYLNAIVPIYDPKWSIKVTDNTKVQKPQDCFVNNLIQTTPNNISCSSTNSKLTYSQSFDSTYKNFPTLWAWKCETHNLNLDSSSVKTYSTACDPIFDTETWLSRTQTWITKSYNFKKIDSLVTHTSPTNDELKAELEYMISPNLPVDKDRYVDFIAADNTYTKINYPYLFRVWEWAKSINETKTKLKKYLDEKSAEINEIITSKDPSKLTWDDKEIYKLLKSWDYPDAKIDLYDYLSKKETKEVEVSWDKKQISYFDTLVFSIYWNNLNSVSAKYKFVFENYLSDQFWEKDVNYFLPKNKKQYEISYLWAPWDAKNMYVSLDPNEKEENPYAQIMAQNETLKNNLLFSNTNANNDKLFKCAPPEWVPIWQWIPAVMCRLKTILPPTIMITDGSCWFSMLSGEYDWEYDSSYYSQVDEDDNGINDYLEDELAYGDIELYTDDYNYHYNKAWIMTSRLVNENGWTITFDNTSKIKLELVKVEVPLDKTYKISPTNVKTIYDKYWLDGEIVDSNSALAEAQKYINFSDTSIRVSNWQVSYNFSTKGLDANVTFRASVTLKDNLWEIAVQKETFNTIWIRWDLFYSTSYLLDQYASKLVLTPWVNAVTASKSNNIFLVDSYYFQSLKTNLNNLNSYSSAENKLFLSLSSKDIYGSLELLYPLKVTLTDPSWKIVYNKSISTLSQITAVWAFKDVWTYTMDIVDAWKNKLKKQIQVLPANPTEITTNLWTNLVEKWWVVTTNVFYLKDEFWNSTSGVPYQVEVSINWNGVTFDDGKTSKVYNVFQGYQIFKLKSTDNTWSSTINFKVFIDWKASIMTSRLIKNVDQIDFDVTLDDASKVKVAWNQYKFKIDLKNITDDVKFNSRAYLVSDSVYVKWLDSYIDIKNNSWTWSFETTKKAWENINLEFKIEWVKNSVYKKVNILPDVPLQIDLSLSKSKLEASSGSTTQLYAELKDRYSNVVWTDNSTKLTLEILDKYKKVITSATTTKQVVKWKAIFTIKATEIPWAAYFKISSDPDLSVNRVEVIWQSPFSKALLVWIAWMRNTDGSLTDLWSQFFSEYDSANYRFNFATLEALEESDAYNWVSQSIQILLRNLFNQNNTLYINWVWENAWRVDTYYFWNKESINGKSYNSIYTTLLWAPYWDITTKDNLANSIIFDRNNRWLSVTSLLNDVTNYSDVLNIKPSWSVILNKSSSDLSQDISTEFNVTSGDLILTFFNNTFSQLVSKIFFSFKNDVFLKSCTDTNFSACLNLEKDTIAIKSIATWYETKLEDGTLSLLDTNWNSVLSVDENWKFKKSSYINFEINSNYKDFLVLNVKNDNNTIWYLIINLSNSQVNVVRDITSIDSVKNSSTKSSVIVYLEWRDYFYKSKYLWDSTSKNIWYTIYYRDPLKTNSSKTTNSFTNDFDFWYEGFSSNDWIWWGWLNKTLLSFSAGKSVWEATKDYMTFSLINIWDPVVSLKPIKKKLPWTSVDRSFDATIWKMISNDSANLSYSVFDYNKDGKKDVVILKNDWFVELLEWTSDINNFVNKWNIIYMSDYSTKWVIQTWDFTWDWFEDIFVVNNESKPILYNNYQKDFYRVDLSNQFWLTWSIMQAISFDMDNDKISDLVTYDDSWTINIFYWSTTDQKNPKFTKKFIDNSLWVKLSSDTRNDNSLVYFDWLYQLPLNDSYVTNSDTLQNIIDSNTEKLAQKTSSNSSEFNQAILDNIIFRQIQYTPLYYWTNRFIWNDNITNRDGILNALPWNLTSNDPSLSEINSSLTDSQNSINDMIWEWWYLENYMPPWSYYYEEPNQTETTSNSWYTTFIKSEYAESEWIQVTKTYTDVNAWTLKSWDKVRLEIYLKNVTSKTLNNITLIEKIPEAFNIDETSWFKLEVPSQTITGSWIIFKDSPDDDYTFLMDSYYYSPNKINTLSLPAWRSLKLTLVLDTKSFDYWYIEAWLFEEWEAWDDEYWDIIFKLKKQLCWETYSIYRSVTERDYEKWLKNAVCKDDSLSDLEKNLEDVDGNNIPDYLDELVESWKSSWDDFTDYANSAIKDLLKDTDWDWISDRDDFSPWISSEEDFMWALNSINEKTELLLEWLDFIIDWFGCWFGWGSCIASPLNWAPLAPWSDPTLFWFPIWDWLKVWEWMPIFATPTIGIPPVWPPSSLWAWGRLDVVPTWLWISQFRVFVTPTITWAVWTAICFWPNAWPWWLPPPWLSPFVPWWNCIVAAMPLFWCKDDWSDGEIYNAWTSSSNIYNWNCESSKALKYNNIYIPTDLVSDYINYKKTWTTNSSFKSRLEDTFKTIASWQKSGWLLNWNWPLIWIFDWTEDGIWEVNLDIDVQALKNGDFSDVVKLKMNRISPFPDFLMDWVTRQVEEIMTKLTDFPTLFIILPSFDWIFDWFKNFPDKISESWNKWKKEWENTEKELQSEIDDLNKQKSNLKCWGKDISTANQARCYSLDFEIKKAELEKDSSINQKASWIRAVYEFLSNLPLIAIAPEKVYVNVPNIDQNTVNKAIADAELTKKQWEEELARAQWVWTLWYACSWTWADKEECEKQNAISEKIILNAQNMIDSIDKNIEILNDYKRFPEKLNKLIRYKEIRLEQLLCNIDTIAYVLGWRIWDNWKRFKAWVELFILMQAILKSWQLLIDVFLEYDASCHQCKNERWDLMYFIWKLISAVIPKIPVIQFPKWPDIYLDLHNIRAWITIWLPEFEFNLRPIVLPSLPNLYLPDVPTVNINLPEIPLLPVIEIPDLPELPSLPEVKLPDLPPPPKLPKLFWALEAILNLLKLITKVMCILKTSPFVPEWRAWDQIAFITERSWFLNLDFLQLSLPQFSLPFVDAIKVTTRVNLEFDAEFIVEASRQALLPVNTFTNDIVNMLDIWIWDLDFSQVIPSEINIDVWTDGVKSDLDTNGWVINTDIVPDVDWWSSLINYKPGENDKISLYAFGMILAKNFSKLYSGIESGKKEVTSEEFKKIIAKELSNKNLYKSENTSKIAWVWRQALDYSYSKEDKMINELLKNNEEKFNTVRDILNEEISKNKELKTNLEKVLKQKSSNNELVWLFWFSSMNSKTQPDWTKFSLGIQTSSRSFQKTEKVFSTASNIKEYNTRLAKYNLKTLESVMNLWWEDQEVKEIETTWKEVLAKVNSWFNKFSSELQKSESNLNNTFNTAKSLASTTTTSSKIVWPLALQNTNPVTTSNPIDTSSSCNIWWENSYVYKWLYYVERFLWRKISYRLFDYLDDLNWDEIYFEKDLDNDSDADVIYMIWQEIFVKESLKNKAQVTHYTWSPLVLSEWSNYIYDDDFNEAVNGFKESISDNDFINVSFMQPTDSKTSNFRIEFYQIVDKFVNLTNTDYIPKNIKKFIVDAFKDIDDITKTDSTWNYTTRKNLAYIKNIWNLAWVSLYTKELKNLEDDLSGNNEVIINAWTKLYTASSNVKIVYYNYNNKNNDLKYEEARLDDYSNISFNQDIVLVSLNSPLYVEQKSYVNLTWNEIWTYVKKPLLPWAEIDFNWNDLENVSSYLSIEYYDWTDADLDFKETNHYRLYDLWSKSDNYIVRTWVKNDFYYGKMRSFANGEFSTNSNQILLSPQLESDDTPPELSWFSNIKIPVYQKVIKDMTDYIYDDGVISDIYIDFDLTKDTSWDGNAQNDKDYYVWKDESLFDISLANKKVKFTMWAFDKLMNKKIRIYVEDENSNVWFKDVDFIVYSPTPKIENITSTWTISWVISENLLKEPVSFYRYRWWNLTRLKDKEAEKTALTYSWWKFDFYTDTSKKWLQLTESWSILASIDEETWKIDLWVWQNISVRVLASDDKNNDVVYPKIILSKDGKDIYYEYLVAPNVSKVKGLTDFSSIEDIWVYYKPWSSSSYSYLEMPAWLQNNAWDLIITDNSTPRKTLAIVYKDWRIEVYGNFSLEYTSFWNKVVYKIIDKSWVEAGRVMVISEKNYVMK